MALKNRINLMEASRKFNIKRENTRNSNISYLICKSLDQKLDEGEFIPWKYWTALDPNDVPLNEACFVIVRESINGVVSEEYGFYFSAGVVTKQKIQWKIQQDKKYGERACKITLIWPISSSETIDRVTPEHIWLANGDKKYSFLVELLGPCQTNKKRGVGYVDEYIIELPSDNSVQVSNLRIEGSDLLLGKYDLIKIS